MSGTEWDRRAFGEGPGAAAGHAPRLLGLLLFLLCALVASAVIWASQAPIEEITRASGTVIPSGRAQTVESLEGGIVSAIEVREGEAVAVGQTLVRIDDTRSSADLGELSAQRLALTARAERLAAELAGAEALSFEGSGIAAESPLGLREVALFDSRLASHFGQRAVLEAQISQRAQEVTELARSIERMDETLALLDEEIALRVESGVVARAQILPLERERTQARQAQDVMRSDREQAQGAAREAEARLTELELQRRAEISTERADTLNELAVIEEAIRRASDVVTRADLRAPVGGIVSALNVNTIGAVITPGEEVLRIVPAEERLQVEARVRPEDIAFLRPDLPASVKLTAFDFTIYGALPGHVLRIGADSEIDEQTGEVYFPIIVETERSFLERAGERLEIRPGMIAQVDIQTGERTVLDYLLKPFRKASAEALRER
ncbi:MAG: HlyD family type I secretion periplasmic adaptor subunit [Pseudomonadota bacterium]